MNTKERIGPTRTGIFAIELIVDIGIFTLCAAVCVGLFIRAEILSRSDEDLVRAVAEARSVSECFKAAGGDLEETAALTGGRVEGGNLTVYYDSNWNKEGGTAFFVLRLTPAGSSAEGFAAADVTVTGENEEEILSWQTAALEEMP